MLQTGAAPKPWPPHPFLRRGGTLPTPSLPNSTRAGKSFLPPQKKTHKGKVKGKNSPAAFCTLENERKWSKSSFYCDFLMENFSDEIFEWKFSTHYDWENFRNRIRRGKEILAIFFHFDISILKNILWREVRQIPKKIKFYFSIRLFQLGGGRHLYASLQGRTEQAPKNPVSARMMPNRRGCWRSNY